MVPKRKSEIYDRLVYKSLVGNHIRIVDSANKDQVGIEGRVVDETKNMFRLLCGNREVKLLKKDITFVTNVEGKTLKIEGELLSTDLVSRIKKIK